MFRCLLVGVCQFDQLSFRPRPSVERHTHGECAAARITHRHIDCRKTCCRSEYLTVVASRLRQSLAPGFMPDNLRWSGDRLIAAGPMYDEPACGGTRLAVVDNPVLTSCHRGYMVAQFDPKTMAWTILNYAEPNPAISVVSTGVLMGDTLWIGAASAEGIAYRPLPRPAGGAR